MLCVGALHPTGITLSLLLKRRRTSSLTAKKTKDYRGHFYNFTMKVLSKSLDRSPSPLRRGGGNALSLSMSRQNLIWLLSVSMFFCLFLGWNNQLSLEELTTNVDTVNKAFQVNSKPENHTAVIKQISLIGERNSGTKWMWGWVEWNDVYYLAFNLLSPRI